MSSTTPPLAQPSKKGRKPEKSEVMADSPQATNEELRSKVMDIQIELQQERGKVCKLRERLQEQRQARELEQHKHAVALTDLRAKLHEEKLREISSAREALARQHEVELTRAIKIRDTEVQRLQGLVNALRDGAADKLKNALLGEAREEARRAFDGERLKLQQEEQKTARKQAEETLANALQADKAKAADLRTAYQQHQDEVHRIKRDCEKDIRRLLKRVREAESQMKPMFEKNKRLSKKNDDLLQTLQRMEEKLKNLCRENAEMVR
ncbi:Janus kinase and microtubule-interacting protein 1 [Xenoophorus captivus]|uniref:Janus kinase and microtubule-interacting protein 1 n=1 Tax=Xenoophorus captivus TaxID=1517983 RepID=A0ABV0RD14_9TELE